MPTITELRTPTLEHGHTSVLDYVVDWTSLLTANDATDADSIATSDWSVDEPGLELGAADGLPAATHFTRVVDGVTRHYAKAWLGGCDLGATYRVTNRITTTQGREAEESFNVLGVDR